MIKRNNKLEFQKVLHNHELKAVGSKVEDCRRYHPNISVQISIPASFISKNDINICEANFVCEQIWSHIDQCVTWHFDQTDNLYSSTGNDQTYSTILADKLNHDDTFTVRKSCTCLIDDCYKNNGLFYISVDLYRKHKELASKGINILTFYVIKILV